MMVKHSLLQTLCLLSTLQHYITIKLYSYCNHQPLTFHYKHYRFLVPGISGSADQRFQGGDFGGKIRDLLAGYHNESQQKWPM